MRAVKTKWWCSTLLTTAVLLSFGSAVFGLTDPSHTLYESYDTHDAVVIEGGLQNLVSGIPTIYYFVLIADFNRLLASIP